MKSLLKQFRELDFTELLKINGGYGGGSGGGSASKGTGSSGYSGSYGSSSSSSNLKPSTPKGSKSDTTKAVSAYASTSGSRYHYNDPRFSYIGGKAYSSVTGFIEGAPAKDSSKDKPAEAETPQNSEKNNGQLSKEDLDSIMSLINIGLNIKDKKDKKAIAEFKKALEDSPFNKLLNIKSSLEKQYSIIKQLTADLTEGNIVYGKDDVRCDNYIQSLLTACGIDYNPFFSGEANEKTVAEHIANLDKSKKYDSSIVKKGNSYVVFMEGPKTLNDGTAVDYSPHCAILTVMPDGTCYMADNSSGNKAFNNNKGLGVTMGKSVSEVQSKFAYSNFYYQKI